MKSLKFVILFSALFCIASNTAFSQANLTEEEKKEVAKSLKEYMAKLDLTDAQKPTYQEVTVRYKKKFTALKNSDAGKLKKYREMKDLVESKNTEMRKLLTKAQYEVYLEQQEKNKEFIKEHKD